MPIIGVELGTDQLVLTRGRDFRWTFVNVDGSTPPVPTNYPAGALYFELATRGEHNGRGHIDQQGANGGTYVLHQGADSSSSLPFDASQAVVKQAIEGFSAVGVGNVNVVGYYTPQWIFTVNWSGAMALSAGVVELFNSTVHAAFSALDFIVGGAGVTLDGHYETSAFVFTMTLNGSLLEQELATFVAGVIGTIISAINTALSAVATFTGFIGSISLIYAPLRHFTYEFINAKALTPMPAITGTSSLTGQQPTLSVVQDVKGRAPFTIWPFTIAGSSASIKIESEDADTIGARTKWQLVFLPTGEPAGGDALARGTVWVQGAS